jgi:hypothetical protein
MTLYDYKVTFSDGSEDIIIAADDAEALRIANNYEVLDRSSWEYRTIPLTPESVYRMDDWGQFTERIL